MSTVRRSRSRIADYFNKLEYMWWYGAESSKYRGMATNLRQDFERSAEVTADYSVRGWIATVERAGQLKDDNDNLNKIVVMVRGKVAQEDILEDFNEGGLYTSYIVGEIHADFLDRDDLEDIATSSRQKIIEDDERYQALRTFLHAELKHIEGQWTDLRNKRGKDKALEIPAIKTWYDSLEETNVNVPNRSSGRSISSRSRTTVTDDVSSSIACSHSRACGTRTVSMLSMQ